MTPTSGVEFLVWLLIVAAIIAMFAKRLRIPYTVSLVVGGGAFGSPPHSPPLASSARSPSRLADAGCDPDLVPSSADL